MEKNMNRSPAVAGLFYPSDERSLREMVDEMVNQDMPKNRAVAAVSPHAGLVYSGSVAGALFSTVELPNKFILIGPSHRFTPTHFPLMTRGDWETPLGNVPIDEELADRLMKKSELVINDAEPHKQEHSLEVQLPFLQYFKPDLQFVPLCVSSRATFEELVEVGHGIAEAVIDSDDKILIVASTDMSHYVSQEIARKMDFMAINKVLELDAEGLYDIVRSEAISMCGVQPTVVALVAANLLGAEHAELIKYQTSGDVSGDFNEVVGYAGISIQ